MNRLRSAGFSMVEVLVVIALLAILAGLVLPAFTRPKGRAKRVVCLNNLRQWGLATKLYIADNNDSLPPEGWPNPPKTPSKSTHTNAWYVLLPAELHLPSYYEMSWRTNPAAEPEPCIWICPANPRRSNGNNLFHYCLNGYADGTGDKDRPLTLAAIAAPARLVWFFDTKNLPAVGYWNFVHTNLHSSGANFLFLDGHARTFRNTEYWDFELNRGMSSNQLLQWIP